MMFRQIGGKVQQTHQLYCLYIYLVSLVMEELTWRHGIAEKQTHGKN